MDPSETFFYALLPAGLETFGIRTRGIDAQERPRPAGSLAARVLRVVSMPLDLELRIRRGPPIDPKAAQMLRHLSWCKAFVSAATRPRRLLFRRSRGQESSPAWEAAIRRRVRVGRSPEEETQVIEALREVHMEPRLDGRFVFTLPADELKRMVAMVALSVVFGVGFGRLRASVTSEVDLVERRRLQRAIDAHVLAGKRARLLRRLRARLDQQVSAKTLSAKARAQILTEAMRTLRRLSPDEWWHVYDEKTKRPIGRPKRPKRVGKGPLPHEMVERVRQMARV